MDKHIRTLKITIYCAGPLDGNSEGVEGVPPQDDGPGLIFHYVQRSILITMDESPWPNTTQMTCCLLMCTMTKNSSCSYRWSLLNIAGGLGCAVSSQWVQGRALVGLQGRSPRSSENLAFYSVIPAMNFKTGKMLQTTHCVDSTHKQLS